MIQSYVHAILICYKLNSEDDFVSHSLATRLYMKEICNIKQVLSKFIHKSGNLGELKVLGIC